MDEIHCTKLAATEASSADRRRNSVRCVHQQSSDQSRVKMISLSCPLHGRNNNHHYQHQPQLDTRTNDHHYLHCVRSHSHCRQRPTRTSGSNMNTRHHPRRLSAIISTTVLCLLFSINVQLLPLLSQAELVALESSLVEERHATSIYLSGSASFAPPNTNNYQEPLQSAASVGTETFQSIRPARQTTTTSSSSGSSDNDANDLFDDRSLGQPQVAFDYHSNMPVITKRELNQAIKTATSTVDSLLSEWPRGDDSLSAGNEMEFGSAGWMASSMFHKRAPRDDPQVSNQTRQAMISEEATRLLARQFNLNRQQTIRGLPLISLDQTSLGKQCPRSSKTFNCIPGRYRSLTGHCNNVQNPDWAAAQTPLVRYAPARYVDHISRPVESATTAISSNGQPNAQLPSARAVSTAIYEASSSSSSSSSAGGSDQASAGGIGQPHSHMTTMMSFFGQFIFHDLAFVPQFSTSARCCPSNANSNQEASNTAECLPIEYRDGEQDYCLDYVRSQVAVRPGCNLGPRDQVNLVSSYLDGSAIYGSSEAQMRHLRTFSGGRLRSQRAPTSAPTTSSSSSSSSSPNQLLELLPQIKLSSVDSSNRQFLNASSADTSPAQLADDLYWAGAARECRQMAAMRRQQSPSQRSRSEDHQFETATGQQQHHQSSNCFQAGDVRVNENIGLTLMHTIWLREHNQIADKLSQLNRHWRDERIFEETRRIVVAELQQVTFAEFLPSIVGEEAMQRWNLSLQSQGYFQGYDPQLNAGTSNELATAVFPFILSTIPAALERYSERLEMLGSTSLSDTFMDGSDLFKRNKFAQYLTGMMSQSAMEPAQALMAITMDNQHRQRASFAYSVDLPNGQGGGGSATSNNLTLISPPQVDAVALTIQQGRDHGLKPYVYWRRACQLRPQVRNWQDLAQVMPPATVEKLKQLYASVDQLDLYLALLENPAPGATVGPTFVCLLARQFYHLKHGDRYWFENDLPGLAFTPRQLDEIRQTSLAKVMCRNSQSSISFIQPSPMIASDPFLNAYQYCTNRAMNELDLSKWRQVVTSAQQVADEQLMSELEAAAADGQASRAPSLARGKRLIRDNVELIAGELDRARGQLDLIGRRESAKLRLAAKTRAKRQVAAAAAAAAAPYQSGHHHGHGHGHAAGYRYLPRLKRQALRINNQSVIFELATNEVVRSLLRRGKDREQAQSIQMDIRDFLYSLEQLQLDNLLANSAESDRFNEFITTSGTNFLTDEQRQRLAAAGDLVLAGDPINDLLGVAAGQSGRTSSVSANCQDDDKVFPCDHTSPFRTITGWCNNLNSPKFGQSFTPLDRILPNAYEDGLSRPRQFSVVATTATSSSSNNNHANRLPLPSPRLISTTIHDDQSNLHVRYSLALMQFGQFGVDHDLTRTPFTVALDGTLLDCSPCDSRRTVHRDCHPIEVPDNDWHYHSDRAHDATGSGKKCLHFVRSMNGQTGLGPRQQINALTAYFDASHVYGSDNCEAKSLRAFAGGRLNASAYPAGPATQTLGYTPREILPVTRANPECVTPSGLCFHAGDQRASEQPGLTSIHTVFMRLHNSIVDKLATINRHWNDEKLYQHGRRIVAAISQRIAYNEFAPRLLGLDYMSKFDLMLKQVGYSDAYDDTCSGSILTEFAAAAFRMGHSLLRGSFPILNRQYKPVGKAFQLRKAFFNSQRILTEPTLIDGILRGIVSTPIESLDNSVTEEVTNHLFEKPKEPFSGMDLVSLNIQRARDHGIPSYNHYRVKCNLTRAKSFDDLAGEIPEKLIKRLASIYASVDDIDLFPGGMSELPVHGGIIGPTFGCIIGMQFARLKRCDRFWHETSDPYVRFSQAQLAEIRKMTLAKVFCSQSDTIDTIQRNAMDVSDHYLNPRVPCSSLPAMDLNVWRENQKSCIINKIKLELGQSKRVNPCRSCTCTTEGPVCRTAKINCLQLMKQANQNSGMLNQIMADKSCLVQCAWALDMQPFVTTGN